MKSRKENKLSELFNIFIALGIGWALNKYLKSDSDENSDDPQMEAEIQE